MTADRYFTLGQDMRALVSLLHLLASPAFFALAALLYFNPEGDHGAMMAGHMAMMGMQSGTIHVFGHDLGPELSVLLASMWFMYFLMGVFHLGAWLNLFTGERKKPKTAA